MACFISRHVSPLERRSHKICQMSGAMDPTRHSTHELSPADILWRVKDICRTSQTVPGGSSIQLGLPCPDGKLFSRHFCS
jgi:hypothetical protein